MVQQHDIGYIVTSWAGPQDRSFAFAHADPNWALVYWDDVGAILVRRTPAAEPYLAEHGCRELSLHDFAARLTSLGRSEADDLFVREVLRNAELAPESVRALSTAAAVLQQRGDQQGSQQLLARAGRLAESRGLSLGRP